MAFEKENLEYEIQSNLQEAEEEEAAAPIRYSAEEALEAMRDMILVGKTQADLGNLIDGANAMDMIRERHGISI